MKIDAHVAINGDDRNDGSADKPVASVQRALELIRAARGRTGGKAAAAKVLIHGGFYEIGQGISLSADDSGSAKQPLVITAMPGETVRLAGGKRIKDWTPVTDASILARLSPGARKHAVQTRLSDSGITDCGILRSRGFSRPTETAALELFADNLPMTLARWPNLGADAHIHDVVNKKESEWNEKVGTLEDGFYYSGNRPDSWKSLEDIWVHGFWGYDWANTYERVATLDRTKRLIKTAPPHGVYHFKAGQRFFFQNILEELDQPGEYYIDRNSGLLYFWPVTPGAETIVSVLSTPLFEIKDASHVRIQSIVIECGRSHGMKIDGGEDVQVRGCVVRNTGNNAIVVNGGNRHIVQSCDLYGMGDGGVFVTGGDRKTLVACGHEVLNNHISRFGRWSRCYYVGVSASGVGIRVANNRIHDSPHIGIIYWGNDMVIERNEIYRVCMEAGDNGAIYSGRTYTGRGNIVRHNYIHNVFGHGLGSACIYMDDGISGQTVYGNILWGADGLWLGGGRDMKIENNLFVDCLSAIQFDSRNSTDNPVWKNMLKGMKKDLADYRYLEPPYITRYPELAKMKKFVESEGGIPCGDNYTANNICAGGNWLKGSMNTDAEEEIKPGCAIGMSGERSTGMLGLEDNTVIPTSDCLAPDPVSGIWRPDPAGCAMPAGFKELPLDRIGLQADEFRRDPVRLAACRLDLLDVTRERKATVKLTVWNYGSKGMRCRGQLTARGPLRLEFRDMGIAELDVAPGEKAEHKVQVSLPIGLTQFDWIPLTDGIRPARVCVNPAIEAERLDGMTPREIIKSFDRMPPVNVSADNKAIGSIRLGWKGDAIVIAGSVHDKSPVRGGKPWKGSSVEICISPDGMVPARQWFLVPPAPGGHAGFWHVVSDELHDAPGSEWDTRAAKDGYDFVAVLPLAACGSSSDAKEVRVEVILRVAGTGEYGTDMGFLCDSWWQPAKFAKVSRRSP